MHPDVKNWIKYARFEEKHGYFAHARKVYERAVEFFGDEHMDEHLYVAFAKFEENQKEVSTLEELSYIAEQFRKEYLCTWSSFHFLIHLSLEKMFPESLREQHTCGLAADWKLSNLHIVLKCPNCIVLFENSAFISMMRILYVN